MTTEIVVVIIVIVMVEAALEEMGYDAKTKNVTEVTLVETKRLRHIDKPGIQG